ncbi:MAG: hypothetical protein K0R93_1041 [Anaerosolibacter sp.]|jgi:hypothetical protein|uniref:phage tail terminator family protein n=1 Tax=Anaerosolibacter sp. TaxID=1872527 RepID=UPI002605036E|nr:hypothetical protein [Anaerosolibacter sp.]MDF2546143.1 hypothetical protein [Anaerosolibacter sp.]
MKLTDIKTAIVDRLKEKIPGVRVVAEEVEQGFKKPAFFVKVILISSERVNSYQTARSIMIMIRYHSETEKENENLAMSDTLERAFKSTLRVDDRRLTIENVDSEIIDKVLHFRFDIHYIDSEEGIVVADSLGNEQVVAIGEQEEEAGYSEGNVELMKELEIKEGE